MLLFYRNLTDVVNKNPRDEVQGGVQLLLLERHFVERLLPLNGAGTTVDGAEVNPHLIGTLKQIKSSSSFAIINFT